MNLSDESVQACKMGHFEEKDLVDFLPELAPLIEKFGERDVVERCQTARSRTGNARSAINAVLAFYRGEHGSIAQYSTPSHALLDQRRSLCKGGVAAADIVAAEHSLRAHFGIDDGEVAKALAAICFQPKTGAFNVADAAVQFVRLTS